MKTNLPGIPKWIQSETNPSQMAAIFSESNAERSGIKTDPNGTVKRQNTLNSGVLHSLLVLFIFAMVYSGCNKQPDELTDNSGIGLKKAVLQAGRITGNYVQHNLVSDIEGFNADRIDPTLQNAWGIAINPTGVFWINANGTDNSEVYNKDGVARRLPVSVPSPSGIVFNSTTDFVIPATTHVSRFIFASEDGNIYAWASGNSAIMVVNGSSSDAVYKGLELASDGGANFLYATDFHNGKIDVFDGSFNLVNTKPFMDPNIPAGFAPFNIRLIDGNLYVTYAKQLAPDNIDDQKGPGNGYVDVFGTDGSLLKRFASQGVLNSPWGIEKAPGGSGQGDDIILIGNFGDGHINVFKKEDGEFLSQLRSKGLPVTIDGLWAITFPDNKVPGDDPNKLYFSAGPNDESNGLFGYLIKQ